MIDLGLARMETSNSDNHETHWTPFEEEIFEGEGKTPYMYCRCVRRLTQMLRRLPVRRVPHDARTQRRLLGRVPPLHERHGKPSPLPLPTTTYLTSTSPAVAPLPRLEAPPRQAAPPTRRLAHDEHAHARGRRLLRARVLRVPRRDGGAPRPLRCRVQAAPEPQVPPEDAGGQEGAGTGRGDGWSEVCGGCAPVRGR